VTILYPVPEILPGRNARFIQILNTGRALAEAGCRVRLCAGIRKGFPPGEVPSAYGLDPSANLEMVRLPVLRGGLSWHGPFHIAFLLRAASEPGSVIFLRHLKLAHFLLRNRWYHRRPLVFEAHEIFHRTTERPGKASVLQSMEAWIYREADAVISITESLAGEIAGMFGRKPEKVIPDGVGSEFLGIGRRGEGAYLLYVGQLFPWKGVEVLVRALVYLPAERAVIVGGSEEQIAPLRRLAESEGVADRIHFAGMVPHARVRGYLEDARIAVLPNLDAGVSRFTSPLKLFEYMAAGVPVVASNLPSLREVLRDGENAILVPPGDPGALAEGIRSLLADGELAARVAARAREEVTGYTWDVRAARILEVLDGLRNR
jgi:glycosyltransferase involved in cell wall biosynthesis